MLRSVQLALLAAALSILPCAAKEPTVTITIDGPTAIGVFPPVSKSELEHDDGGLSEGMAHVQFALEDLGKCLSPRKVTLRFELTRSVVIRDGAANFPIAFSKEWAHAVGIVLVAPGRAPVTVLATNGPSGLIETAPQAAWKYFSEPNCKRYEEKGAT